MVDAAGVRVYVNQHTVAGLVSLSRRVGLWPSSGHRTSTRSLALEAISLASRIGRHEQPQSLSERHHHSRDGLRRDSNPAYARAVLQLRQAARRFALSYQLPPARTGMTWSTTDARP